ncbi:MAG: InlB B-repeat-containing protein [Christensenellaceae bacterium]|nr:InlB B-repeat-containing protein [Christensenellaceae bacterium]
MYLDDVHLLDNTSYYGVMEDHFVATVDGTLYQIPMKVLRALCQQASEQSKADTAQLLPYMTEFDLYGIYDVAELLNLDDPDRTCAYCEGTEGHQENDYYDSTVMPDAGSQALERTPTNAGLMILNQSIDLTGHTWTPKKAVYSYPRDGVITTFALNKTQTGIPYSRGARFAGTSYANYPKTIVFNSNYTPKDTDTSIAYISLAHFDSLISSTSAKFYEAALACPSSGPLYGMDCSAFLSYCWGIKSHVGTSNFANPSNNPYCTKLSVSSSSLGILEVGDALISTGDDSHCVFISKIPLNADGSIGSIQITEETPPKTVTRPLTVAKFCSEFLNNGYSAYRFKYKTLTFNANGGVVFPRTMKVVPNIPYSYGDGLPKATRSGYTFMGWYTASSGGTKVTNSSVNSGSNQTLYAHWIMESIVEGIAEDTRISLTTNNARD